MQYRELKKKVLFVESITVMIAYSILLLTNGDLFISELKNGIVMLGISFLALTALRSGRSRPSVVPHDAEMPNSARFFSVIPIALCVVGLASSLLYPSTHFFQLLIPISLMQVGNSVILYLRELN